MDKNASQSKVVSCDLTPENKSLLERISKFGIKGKRPYYPETKEPVYLWEGRVFKEFILRRKDLKQKFKQLFEDKDKTSISYQTFYVCDSGMGAESTERIFYLTAELYGKTATEFLREFVEYCIEKKDFTPRAFKEDDEIILKLLGKNEKPKDSLQDIKIINDEIEAIRKDLNYYPYGKNTGRRFNPTKAELAVSRIDQLLNASPDNSDLLALKAGLLTGLGKLDEALKLSEELYAKNSTHLRVTVSYSNVLNKLKRYKDALNINKEAKQLHPNAYPLAIQMARTFQCLGQYEEAIEEYKRAISLDKDDAFPYYKLAFVYDQINQQRLCESVLTKALHIAPNNPDVLLKMITTLSRQGKNDEASQYAQHLVELDNTQVVSILAKVSTELANGNVSDAKSMIDKTFDTGLDLLENKMVQSHAYYGLGVIFLNTYKGTSNRKPLYYANECLIKALDIYPKNYSALKNMAMLSFYLGKDKDAELYLDQIHEIYKSTSIDGSYGWDIYVQLSIFTRNICKDSDYRLPLIWCAKKYGEHLDCNIKIAQEYLSLGDELVAKKFIDKALTIYQSDTNNNDFSSYEGKILCNLAQLLKKHTAKWPHKRLFLQKAIDIFNVCLTKVSRETNLDLWQEAMVAKGESLHILGNSCNNRELLTEAICCYKELLEECPSYKYRGRWLDLNNAIGGVYWDMGCIDNNLNDFEAAAKYKKKLLQEITIESERENWLSHVHHISDGLIEIGKRCSNSKSIEEAISFYNSVLDALNKDEELDEWAKANIALGKSYLALGEITQNIEYFSEAEKTYRLVTKLSENLWLVDAWQGIGEACLFFGKKQWDADVLASAIEAFKSALVIIDKDQEPSMWEHNQYLLARTYQSIGWVGSDCQYLLKSVDAYDLALECTKSNGLTEYFNILYERGHSLYIIAKENSDPIQLSKGIDSLNGAIKLIHIDERPIDYANIHFILGDAMALTGELNGDISSYRLAMASYHESQRVFTEKNYPEDWNELKDRINFILTERL